MLIGGRPHGFFSRVVAIKFTLPTNACSAIPWQRFIFHTSACFFASYLALPAQKTSTLYLTTFFKTLDCLKLPRASGPCEDKTNAHRAWRVQSSTGKQLIASELSCKLSILTALLSTISSNCAKTRYGSSSMPHLA